MNATDTYRADRLAMVQNQIARRGITDPAVLAVMRTVPRHRFVPDDLRAAAYADRALPLGPQQTISQPYIVALMTSMVLDGVLDGRRDRALEIGTGSGYQSAVLAELFGEVHTVEVDAGLAAQAAAQLAELQYRNVHVHQADGRAGWPDAAPYDAILITAATSDLPEPLLAQLAVGGRLGYPHGDSFADQTLRVIERVSDDEYRTRDLNAVRFVPLR